ncbi:hypothetical protein VRU48_18305 [Pedobacter sp. KR3-3]|uniref:Uncharacterized protein n=1 Tax=Pedobacter albus TaxID=3113905 RepID=A0ABU7ICA7_9SPHI|nr:hypothetical protein [Pedobacter sp. KR3-3]MEE1947084.1 hypothetical protein [Pedobacter sp. KR3-3]
MNQLTNNAEALRLFFTEDVYLVQQDVQATSVEPLRVVPSQAPEQAPVALPKAEPVPTTEKVVSLPTMPSPQTVAKTSFDFKFLGKNQKQILILVNDNVNEVSTEQGRELLRKLVKAIDLTANDFALVNYANYVEAKFQDLSTFFSCKLVLSFGVTAQQLDLAEQPLHQLAMLENIQFVFTHNLHSLDSDQQSKKVLWGSLQQLKK